MKLELIVPATQENLRKRTKAICPPLGLAMVAALTPPEVEVSLTDENVTAIDCTIRFARKMRLESAQFAWLVSYPGTALCESLDKAGRIVTKDWSQYESNPVFEPKLMSREMLKKGHDWTWREFYSLDLAENRVGTPEFGAILGNESLFSSRLVEKIPIWRICLTSTFGRLICSPLLPFTRNSLKAVNKTRVPIERKAILCSARRPGPRHNRLHSRPPQFWRLCCRQWKITTSAAGKTRSSLAPLTAWVG